jgi:predicted MFS family arabinose efflux permease
MLLRDVAVRRSCHAPPDSEHGETGAPAGSDPSPGKILIVIALLPFALGYLLSYLYRAVNAVVAPDLVREIGLSASELGLLTAAYLASFSIFQLPLGVLLDRYGPRRVQAFLVALGAAGALLFALAGSALTLTLARALIGIGFCGGLMAGFKAVVIWVPEPRRALANACIMSLGGLGLICATTPLELASQSYGWRAVFFGLAAATIAVALLILLAVPERKTKATSVQPLSIQLRQVGQIYSDRIFLAVAPLLATTAGAHIAIQTLWAGPWFRDIGGLDRLGVANSLLAMAIGFSVSVLLTGLVADRLVKHGYSLLTVMMGFLVIYLGSQALLLLNPSSQWAALTLWCVFAMTGHVAVLAYPWFARYFGASLSGRSNTAINLMMFVFAFLAQYAIGWMIGHFTPRADGGYTPVSYQVAFGVIFAMQLLALAWYLFNVKRIRAAQQG